MRSYLRGFAEIVGGYLRIAELVPSGGKWLAGTLVALNLILGLLPTVLKADASSNKAATSSCST